MTTLDELRERLEKAEGPDRELDAALMRELNQAAYMAHEMKAGGLSSFHWATPYTASLDAAIALVEAKLPGWKRQMQEMPNGAFRYWLSYDSATAPSEHKSEPIALLLALLSALEKESAE